MPAAPGGTVQIGAWRLSYVGQAVYHYYHVDVAVAKAIVDVELAVPLGCAPVDAAHGSPGICNRTSDTRAHRRPSERRIRPHAAVTVPTRSIHTDCVGLRIHDALCSSPHTVA